MPVIRAKLEHLVEVRELLRGRPGAALGGAQHGRRAYSDFGLEDLPDFLARGPAVVGVTHGQIWGVACVQVEERPETLPPAGYTRAHLRCIALRANQPAAAGVAKLMDGMAAELTQPSREPLLLVSYGVHDWLCQGLARSGFDLLDTVEFFQLERLRARVAQRPPLLDFLHLQLAEPAVLPDLAQLDAAAFPPLWHFGARDLVELCLRCRVQVAYLQPDPVEEASLSTPGAGLGQPVGYAAVCYNSREEAQLARLAVAPAHQGRGIGRALLWDALADAAAANRRTLVLNTQRDNHRSRQLYLGMGFRPLGEALPVLARVIGAPGHKSANSASAAV